MNPEGQLKSELESQKEVVIQQIRELLEWRYELLKKERAQGDLFEEDNNAVQHALDFLSSSSAFFGSLANMILAGIRIQYDEGWDLSLEHEREKYMDLDVENREEGYIVYDKHGDFRTAISESREYIQKAFNIKGNDMYSDVLTDTIMEIFEKYSKNE